MQSDSRLDLNAQLEAIVVRRDGSVENLGVISGLQKPQGISLSHDEGWFKRLWRRLRSDGRIPATLSLGAFTAELLGRHLFHGHFSGLSDLGLTYALVTTSGVNYMASDFASGQASPRIGAFNFHDCGTGAGTGSTVNVSAATNATPIVLTTAAHGKTSNDLIVVASVGGNTNANGNWQCTVGSSTTLTLIGSAGNSAYTSGGTVQLLNGAGDTALTTAAGTARVSGTQSNPSSNQYRSVGTIAFTSTLAISEWGLFSASSSGTLWDRRWFNSGQSPQTTATAALTSNSIGVNNGDSISFTYTLTVTAGGS
jgi:hypothetical protein